MSESTKMRPCRPGDVLATATVPCGAMYQVILDELQNHPPRGVHCDIPVVRVKLLVSAPAAYGYLIDALQEPSVSVLGSPLISSWGCWVGDDRTRRVLFDHWNGVAVALLVATAKDAGDAALRAIQGVHDAHAASVAALESARAAAYAAFPVADTERKG